MQIVALVRALALEPATLLLDEPTASLDQPTAQAAEDLLGRWAAERPDRSLVWVSHDTAMRQRVTNRTIHIEGGDWWIRWLTLALREPPAGRM